MVSVFRLPASLKQDEAQGQLGLEELDGTRLSPASSRA